MYDPNVGRFVSPDPVKDDHLRNLYRYVGNNPINAIDPSGQQPPSGVSIDDLDPTRPLPPLPSGEVPAPPLPTTPTLPPPPPSGLGALGDPPSTDQLPDTTPVTEKERLNRLLFMSMDLGNLMSVDDCPCGPASQEEMIASFFELAPTPLVTLKPAIVENKVDPPWYRELLEAKWERDFALLLKSREWGYSQWCECLEGAKAAVPEEAWKTIVGVWELLQGVWNSPGQVGTAIVKQITDYVAELKNNFAEGKIPELALEALALFLPYLADFIKTGDTLFPREYCKKATLAIMEAIALGVTLGTGAALQGAANAVSRVAKIAAGLKRSLGVVFDKDSYLKLVRLLQDVARPKRIKNVRQIDGSTVTKIDDGAWVVKFDDDHRKALVLDNGLICPFASPIDKCLEADIYIGKEGMEEMFRQRVAAVCERAVEFVGTYRGRSIRFPGVRRQCITFTKRSPSATQALRRTFSNTVKPTFLRALANDKQAVMRLKAAGLTDSDIKLMADGRNPIGYEVHHRVPLDGGGTNDVSNLMLMKTEPHHRALTYEQRLLTGDMVPGDTRKIDFPLPEGIVYPP